MRRARLSPTRAITDRETPPLDLRRLAGPSQAEPRARHLFHPRRGWFRRFERAVNQYLSRNIFPRLPGVAWFYGLQLDRDLTLVEGEVELHGLPAEFDGTSLLLVTDIHAGPFLTVDSLRRTFGRLLTSEPDLILLGGDFTTARLSELPPHAATYASLRAPLGVFAVLGNHDHYTGETGRLRGLLADCGIEVLHNRSVEIRRGSGRIILAGIDDLHSGDPDIDAALAYAPPGILRMLLSHNPDIFFEAARRGVALVLSGHTHGGQIRIPGLPVLVRMSRYRLDEGFFETDRTRLVVSRGLGVTGVPLRLACPPEAIRLRLRCAPPL